jgi:hypothetical protein
MCTACLIAIGGGLLIANKLGVKDLVFIGVLTLILSYLLDKLFRKINHGKALFRYQKVIIPIVILLIAVLTAKFLL